MIIMPMQKLYYLSSNLTKSTKCDHSWNYTKGITINNYKSKYEQIKQNIWKCLLVILFNYSILKQFSNFNKILDKNLFYDQE